MTAVGGKPQQGRKHVRGLAAAAMAEDQGILVPRSFGVAGDHAREQLAGNVHVGRHHMRGAHGQHDQIAGVDTQRRHALHLDPVRRARAMRIMAPVTPVDFRLHGAVSAKRAVTARSERQISRTSLSTSMARGTLVFGPMLASAGHATARRRPDSDSGFPGARLRTRDPAAPPAPAPNTDALPSRSAASSASLTRNSSDRCGPAVSMAVASWS